MKYINYTIYILLFASFQIDGGKKKINADLKKQIVENTTRFKVTEITFDKINISSNAKQFKESPELFSILHDREMYEYENELILVNFLTSDNSIGIIAYARISECDHPSDYYYLYVIHKDGNVSEPILIRIIDNSITVYEVDFKFIDGATVQLSEKTSSEWAIEDDSKADTLFTTKYKIAYLKTPYDTLETKHFQKILKK